MTDRTQALAEVFARLRWCVGGEFSVTINSSQAELLLDALAVPRAVDSELEAHKIALDNEALDEARSMGV